MSSDLIELRRGLEQPLSHPDLATLRQYSEQTLSWILAHFESLPRQEIGLTASPAALTGLLDAPPPEMGESFAGVFAEFQEKVAPYAFRVNHPRFLAFIPGSPSFLSILGDLLCAGTNFFAGVWLEASGPTQVELVVLDWFRQFLGMPAATRGILTQGGSEANLTALVVARESLSFDDRRRAVLYLTQLRHGSVDRAAKVIGLHPDQLHPIAADAEFRLDPGALQAAIHGDRSLGLLPWMVVANAGATNTGTVDPLDDLARVCREEKLWFHVDAAYGWPGVLVPECRRALKGLELADSVTLDPHKWFGQTFEVGCLLVRDGPRLTETFRIRPDYMQDVEPAEDEVNFADRGIALTRRFRALKIWLSVKVLGLGWYRELVTRCCGLAEYAQRILERSSDFEVMCPRQLSIICFRYVARGRPETEADRMNLDIVEELRSTGQAFLSSTRLRDRVALRFCFVNWRTTCADVDLVIGLLGSIGKRVSGS